MESEGFRSANVTDVDDAKHRVVVEFPHEVLDNYQTDWGVGCFDDSLRSLLPPMVWNHDPADLIGRAESFESTRSATRIVSRFSDFDAVPRARQAFAQIRDGDVPGFSFHYRDGKAVRHPNVRGAMRFTKARLLETSPVMFPSIPGAKAVGIRSSETPMPDVDLDTILRLRDAKMLDDAGVRDLLGETFPSLRERIVVTTSPAGRLGTS